MNPAQVDVIVIGAGAAGLLGAAVAAERGRKVLLLEKNRKPGVKILMSGGTRCNITQSTDSQGIVDAFGRQGRFLYSALAALDPEQLVAMFEREGVATKVEETGKIFPRSDRAVDVLNALLQRLRRSGAKMQLECAVESVEHTGAAFCVSTGRGPFEAESLMLTTGGQSYPGCGTTGDGYAWAKQFGHRIVPPRPALVPLTATSGWVHQLSGVTIPDVTLRLTVEDKKLDKRLKKNPKRGSFLFTHRGVSGPAVLDISREFTQFAGQEEMQLLCDFIPEFSAEQLQSRWRDLARKDGRRSVANDLSSLAPKRLIEALFEIANIPASRSFAELSNRETSELIQHLKAAPIPLSGTLGFKKAEVTAGGVDLGEVHSQTMESKLASGLFFAGEVLDLDGPIGGYNFQAAWSTAYLAASHV